MLFSKLMGLFLLFVTLISACPIAERATESDGLEVSAVLTIQIGPNANIPGYSLAPVCRMANGRPISLGV